MSPPSSESTASVTIIRSELFSRQYEEIHAHGKHGGGRRGRAFHQRLLAKVDHLLTELSFPHEAFTEHRKLGVGSYDLTGISRLKGPVPVSTYGVRIFYLCDEPANRVVVLELGERSPGSPTDAYEVFGQRLKTGYFDAYFRAIGQTHAYWVVPTAPTPLGSRGRGS